ncbi:hypothetical protein ABZ897_26120 [Nonomuraea sp. NPDC046802]|uniref:hypothetical protein n=1 Tax=Nonomuraea sp. NPDC046802 TaxID=3154919 RepID=UPI003409DACB
MGNKDELRQVEEDLVRLRAQNQEMRRQVREVGATDQVEVSAMISQADELMELIAELERRRDTLRERVEKGEK